jgi:hypothetical protein
MIAKKRGVSVTLREVGIFYVIGDKLFLESTSLSRAGHHGDNLVHERSHYEYWAQLVKMGAVPRAGCEDFPRGRVAYGNKIGKFFLLADACILDENKVLDSILTRLHLPTQDTETGTVSIYRCHRCLGRIR